MRKLCFIAIVALVVGILGMGALFAQDPIVKYTFDNISGTTVNNDGTGGATYNGAADAAITYAAGHISNAAVFSNARITVPALPTAATKFTISFWMYVTGVNTTDGTALAATDGWTGGSFITEFTPNGWGTPVYGLQFGVNGGPDIRSTSVFGPGGMQNQWVHVALTYDNSTNTSKIYINGANERSGTAPRTVNFSNMRIGSWGTTRRFAGMIDDWRYYDYALTQADVTALYNSVTMYLVKGTVKDTNGAAISGATVYYSLTSGSGYATTTTASDGTYSFNATGNSGPYYIKAGKAGYYTSAEYSPAPSVIASNVTGIDLTLTKQPGIMGQVTDSVTAAGIAGASVTISPNPADSESPQTVTTDASGNYVAYVTGSKTYSVTASKTRYTASTPVDVVVASADVTHNISLVKNAALKLVDLYANELSTGPLTSWPNTNGTKGGSFANASSTASVVAKGAAPGGKAVYFGGGTNDYVKSSWTSAAADGIVGPDTQYTVAVWILQPSAPTTGAAYMSLCGPCNGAGGLFRLDGFNAWSNIDRGAGQWVGWGGGWTTGTAPAPGSWHLVVNTYDGRLDHVIVDGVDHVNTGQIHTLNLNTGAPITLGRGYWGNINNADQGGFIGYVSRLRIWDQALSVADVQALYNNEKVVPPTISGLVTDVVTGLPIAGATVVVNTSTDGGVTLTPYLTTTTAADGTYTAAVDFDTTFYVVASKAAYYTSSALTVPVAGVNVPNQNFTLTPFPRISGTVKDALGAAISNATIAVNTSVDGGVTLTPYSTVTTAADGTYSAPVPGSTTYYLVASKLRYSTSDVKTVPVATSNITGQDFTLTKTSTRQTLVDLDASSLPIGALTSWPNPGTLGGSFDNTTSTATVVADATLGKNVVQFSGGAQDVLRSSFTMATSSNIVGPDCQYATATWLYITDTVTVGRYLQWAHGPWYPASAMWFNCGTIAWGVTDHLNSTFLGWGSKGYPGPGAWHLLICQFDGTTESAYLDGALLSRANRNFNPTPGATMDIGCADFKGFIAKLQVYDEALSIKDIAHLNGKYVIEGKVTLPDGTTPVAGATITLDGANAATSAADGTYMLIVVPGTYTVGATKAGMITLTADQSVTVAAADVANVDFQMYTMPIISGKVTLADNVTPVAGVALRLNTGATTNSAADGTYSFGVPGNTFYTLTITAPAGYSIVGPAVRGIDVGTENVPDINFVLAPNSITGRIINGAGAGIYNAIVQIGGVGGPAAVTDAQGYYTMAFNAGGVSEVYADALGYANNAASVDLSAGGSITAPTITLASKDETDASYIQNGNFESGTLAPWTLDPGDAATAIELGVSSAEKFSGSYSGYWKGLDGVVTYAGWLTQHVPVVAGSTYNVYFKVKSSRPGILSQTAWKFLDAEGNDLNYREMSEGDTGGHAGWLTSLNGTWQQAVTYRDYNFANPGAACRIEAPAGAAYIVVWTNSASATAGDEVWIDDVVIDRVGDIYVPPVTGPTYGCNNKVCLTDAKLTGKLVKVWGKIQSFGTGSYTISDGYSSPVTIIGTTTGFAGDLVVVTGTRQADGTVKP